MSIGREEKTKLRRRDKHEGKRWRKMKTPKVMPTQWEINENGGLHSQVVYSSPLFPTWVQSSLDFSYFPLFWLGDPIDYLSSFTP